MHGGRGHSTENYTGTQSFMNSFSPFLFQRDRGVCSSTQALLLLRFCGNACTDEPKHERLVPKVFMFKYPSLATPQILWQCLHR